MIGWILGCALLLDGTGAEHPPVCDDRHDNGLLEVRAAALTDGLWIGLEFDAPEAPGSGSGLVLHLDVDGNATTGDRHGCELVYDLKARHGALHPRRDLEGGGRLFQRLGLQVSPSFESNRCELFLPRGELLTDANPRFFVVASGDRAPDEGWIELEWTGETTPASDPVSLAPAGFRVAYWNIERDGLFERERKEALRRLLRTLDADVLVVAESFTNGADAVREQVDNLSGLEYPHAVKADPGNVVLSRYPITESWSIIDGPEQSRGHRVSAVLLDTPNGPFMVLPQHWRCCGKEGERLFEADALVAFLRDAFTPLGNIRLDREVPFVILGDLNLVRTRRPLDVVLTGIVIDKDSFAPDFPAGPGRTPLRAVELEHPDAPIMTTWRSTFSNYYDARLDWVLLPENVRVVNGFVLDTETLSEARLRLHGLDPEDSTHASDHAPVVVDLEW